jgi:hypothetical protein
MLLFSGAVGLMLSTVTFQRRLGCNRSITRFPIEPEDKMGGISFNFQSRHPRALSTRLANFRTSASLLALTHTYGERCHVYILIAIQYRRLLSIERVEPYLW